MHRGSSKQCVPVIPNIKGGPPSFNPYFGQFLASPLHHSLFGSIYHLLVAMVSLYINIHLMSPLFWSIYHHLRAVMPSYTLLWSIQSVARAQEYICIAMCEIPSYNHHRLVISLDHLILFDQSEKLQGGGGLYS